MRKLLTFLIALGAIVFAIVSPASANGVLCCFVSAPAPPPATYQGPGDIAAFQNWYSCAFANNALLIPVQAAHHNERMSPTGTE